MIYIIKKIKYFLQSIIFYSFLFIGRIVGLKIGRKLFAFLFSVVGPHFKSKKIIKENLNIFFNNTSRRDENAIINDMWKNYGMTFVEYVFLNFFQKNNSHINIEGEENLFISTLNEKPVIFVSGHFANYELMCMEITKKNISLAAIYRPLNNIFLNPFMEYLRKKYVCKNQIKKGIKGVREVIEYIKNKHSIALMIDQRVSEGEKLNFFGKPALTTTLPAQLSIKYNLDIIPVFTKRNEKNIFKIEFQKRINPKNFRNKLEITKELNRVLEKMIARNPNQWIWTHNRWK
tara:strand:+ start:1705 stop:2571 length:867 start_codon:yes stop_codon:yes gene_type:complete